MLKYRYKIKFAAYLMTIILILPNICPVFATDADMFEDDMSNLGKIYSCEGTFLIKNDLDHPEDQYRIYKSSVEKQSITYKTEKEITGFEIKTYSTQKSIDKMADIYLSADGEKWTECEYIFDIEQGYVSEWNWSYLTQKKAITEKYYYIKIVIGDGKNTWNPQISNVALFFDGMTGRPYTPEPPIEESAEERYVYKNNDAAAVVFGNNILNENETSPDRALTRGEFARAVTVLSGMDADNMVFTADGTIKDVSQNTKYASCIYYVVNGGLMNCYADKTFESESFVSFIQAVKSIVRLLGYGENLHSDNEYISKAASLGLLKGIKSVSYNDSLYAENALVLFYNVLSASPLVWRSSESSSVSDRTLLEMQSGVQKRFGQITATYFGSLTQTDIEDKNRVEIDGIIYKTYDESIITFLGRGVYYYTDKDNNIISFYISDAGADPITVLSEDIISDRDDFSKKKIIYDDDGRNKSISVDFDFMAYNGYCTDISYDTLMSDDARIKFYDSDEDNKYDTAMVEKYSYIVVKNINAEKGIIQGIYGEILDLESYDKYDIYNIGGNIAIDEIKSGNTLSLLADKDKKYLRAYVRTVKLKGKLTAISDDEYFISDGSFKISKEFKKLCENGTAVTPKLGMTGIFYLGCNYEIIGFTANTAVKQYVYAYDGSYDEWKNVARIKLYTDDGQFVNSESRFDLKINGKTKKVDKKTFESIFFKDGIFDECVMSVDWNDDGSIKKADKDVSPDFETLSAAYNGNNILCGSYPITSDTKVFSIPKDRGNRESFSTKLSLSEGDTKPNSSDMKYHIRFYNLNDMNSPEVLVIYQDDKNDSRQGVITKIPAVVNGITEVYDKEKCETKTKLMLGTDNNVKEFEVSENVNLENMLPAQNSFTDLNPGDIILYATNVRDQIVRIVVIYHSDGRLFLGSNGMDENYDENIKINPDYPIIYGSVKNYGSGFLIADIGEKISAVTVSSSTRYFIIDTKTKNTIIETATEADICFGDPVLIKSTRFNASDIFIFRN